MWKIILLSLVGVTYAIYPYSVNVLYDPKSYDKLIDSTDGPIVENWWFSQTGGIRIVSVTLPSQLQGSSPSFYQEHIRVKIRKNYKGDITELASGEFRGFVSYGSEITIPLFSAEDGTSYPIIDSYGYPEYSASYLVEVSLNVPGYYPYHNMRYMDEIPAFHQKANSEGIIIGMDYSFMYYQ